MTAPRPSCELLAPAGSLDKLKIALRYGADAIYLGGKAFNLRARSSNFSKDDLAAGIRYAHDRGKKVYITLNILAHEREMKALPSFLGFLREVEPDAVIVADLGIMDLVQEHAPNIPIHISTQASATNARSIRMWQKLGAKRVVLARELGLKEIAKIKKEVPSMELEVFVHGAMCMTYSGRCNLSNYFSERDGNRGVCSNTCRWKYTLMEEKRPGEYYPVYEDDTGTYIYNSKDLCTIDFLDEIVAAGVSGLKIEGRMKTHFYVANATNSYRKALDACLAGNFVASPQWRRDLEKMNHRGYTSGFFHGKLEKNSEQTAGATFGDYRFAGLVDEDLGDGRYRITCREKFADGAAVEVLRPGEDAYRTTACELTRADSGERIPFAQPNMEVIARVAGPVSPLDVIITETTTKEAPQ